jgi:hypothetical protein
MNTTLSFCHKCGAPTTEEDRYCGVCGAAFTSSAPPKPNSQASDHPKIPPYQETFSTPPPPPPPSPETVSHQSPVKNTSGQGKTSLVPPEIQKWNWGACVLSWIWGIGNKTYIALLTLLPVVGIIMMFILGAKGNEWAWQNNRWDSIEHFENVQRRWAMMAWALILLLAVVSIISVVVN